MNWIISALFILVGSTLGGGPGAMAIVWGLGSVVVRLCLPYLEGRKNLQQGDLAGAEFAWPLFAVALPLHWLLKRVPERVWQFRPTEWLYNKGSQHRLKQ